MQRELNLARHSNTSKIPNTVQAHHAATHLWDTNTDTVAANVSIDSLVKSIVQCLGQEVDYFLTCLFA